MSKPVKDMIASEYTRRFEGVTGAVVVEIRGLDAKATTSMRGSLLEKGIKVTIVKNALARRTFKGGPLASLEKALKGPSAMLTGAENAIIVARAIVKAAEEKGCDLIMMASHGRRGVKGLLLGSETQKVLTHSKIPVLVYR